ncbi:MAG: LURP-one-related family protein [Anaerolineales bacterium]|nr:LURP-one-related family protein [Anaerolineales bacterium]
MNRYIIDQKLFSIRGTYLIKDANGGEIGKVDGKLLSWGANYQFVDTSGQMLGRLSQKVIRIRPTFQILDANEKLVVTMKQKLFKLIGSEYWFEDPTGHEILRAKGKFHAHAYTLFDNQGGTVAEVNKKWVSLRDSYGVEIFSSTDRLIVLGAVICIDIVEHSARNQSE